MLGINIYQLSPIVLILSVLMTIHRPQAYVWDYNIYLKTDATAEAVQVTKNGKVNEILNGVPDWVYEGNALAHTQISLHVHAFIHSNLLIHLYLFLLNRRGFCLQRSHLVVSAGEISGLSTN